MTSYIVRFFSSVPEQVRGTVRHVRTGEETVFSSPAELLRFFERVNATELAKHEDAHAWPEPPSAPDGPTGGPLAGPEAQQAGNDPPQA